MEKNKKLEERINIIENEISKSKRKERIFIIIIVLLIFDKITLFTIALTRSITEIILFGIRYYYFCTYKKRMALWIKSTN